MTFVRILPIIFGCHQKPERSFRYKGKIFPICARCTGELIGILIAAISFTFYIPNTLWCFMLLIPMLVDGFVQLLTSYESNNLKRVSSGFLFGYGLCQLFVLSTIYTFELGQHYAATYLSLYQ